MYPRGANPRTARRILRKTYYYAAKEVAEYRADWVNPDDPREGIVPREYLPSEKIYAALPDENERLSELGPPPEAGLKFIPPPMEKNPLIARVQSEPVMLAARCWDWTREPIPA